MQQLIHLKIKLNLSYLLLYLNFFCIAHVYGDQRGCRGGEFNGGAVVESVGNEGGIVILTVSGGLRAMGRTLSPPFIERKQRAVILRKTKRAYAAVYRSQISDTLVAWGDSNYGGDASIVMGMHQDKGPRVISLHATDSGFAALLSLQLPSSIVKAGLSPPTPRRVVAWGNRGGTLPPRLSDSNVVSLHSTLHGFAVVLPVGEIITWGHCDTNGERPSLVGVEEEHRPLTALAWVSAYCSGQRLAASDLLTRGGVAEIQTTQVAGLQEPMAMVVITPYGGFWGWATDSVLSPPSSIVDTSYRRCRMASTSRAFAAITHRGGVVAWGDSNKGGRIPRFIREFVSTRGKALYATLGAFAILTTDGMVSVWGDVTQGGFRISGVVAVAATHTAFAFLLLNASVTVLEGDGTLTHVWWLDSVTNITSSKDSFLAEHRGGGVVSWGAMQGATPLECRYCGKNTWAAPHATQCSVCETGYWSETGATACHSCVLSLCQDSMIGSILGISLLLLVICAVCICDAEE